MCFDYTYYNMKTAVEHEITRFEDFLWIFCIINKFILDFIGVCFN